MFTFFGNNIPKTLWNSEVLYLPDELSQAHKEFLEDKEWLGLYQPKSAGVIGGASSAEAQDHVINRFLNSAARMQYVCVDPKDEQPDVREMIFDQLGDGAIHILDLGAGNGAGTLAILALICELRSNKSIPKLPLNITIFGVDYSPYALNYYAELQEKIKPWLAKQGIHASLELEVCDLTIAGNFNESMDSFFEVANKQNIKRFLCVISAITGLGKEGLDSIHDSLKIAAARLSNSKLNSSWLWVEPNIEKNWVTVFMDTIKHTLQKVKYVFSKKGDEYNIKSDLTTLAKIGSREFKWHDPHISTAIKSRVCVLSFKNNA